MASGSAAGSVHVWRIEYATRAGGGAPERYTGCSGGALRQVCVHVCMSMCVRRGQLPDYDTHHPQSGVNAASPWASPPTHSHSMPPACVWRMARRSPPRAVAERCWTCAAGGLPCWWSPPSGVAWPPGTCAPRPGDSSSACGRCRAAPLRAWWSGLSATPRAARTGWCAARRVASWPSGTHASACRSAPGSTPARPPSPRWPWLRRRRSAWGLRVPPPARCCTWLQGSSRRLDCGMWPRPAACRQVWAVRGVKGRLDGWVGSHVVWLVILQPSFQELR